MRLVPQICANFLLIMDIGKFNMEKEFIDETIDKYAELVQDYRELEKKYNNLQEDYKKLSNKYDKILQEYNDYLQQRRNELHTELTNAQFNAIIKNPNFYI